MKLYSKIDLYVGGRYVCSTNQSRTLQQAMAAYRFKVVAGERPNLHVVDLTAKRDREA